MKIGIIADSHDNMPAIAKAVGFFNDTEVSMVIHAGDLIAPFVHRAMKNLKMDFAAVFGNNDGERFGLDRVFGGKIHRPPFKIDFAGKKILVIHEPDNLEVLVDSGHFDAVIYGHTHDVDVRKGRTLIINPGECGGWLRDKRTVALWDLESQDVDVIPV
jgi:putative phosphoesterase